VAPAELLRTVTVPAQVADSSAFRIRSTAAMSRRRRGRAGQRLRLETTVPSALRASIVSVCVVSPALDETTSTVSPAVTWVKSGGGACRSRRRRGAVDVGLRRGVVLDEVGCDDRRHRLPLRPDAARDVELVLRPVAFVPVPSAYDAVIFTARTTSLLRVLLNGAGRDVRGEVHCGAAGVVDTWNVFAARFAAIT
jgi:hypothetical protein